jgi:excisionase family DNA binding protein
MTEVLERLERIEKLLLEQQPKPLSLSEAATYLNISKSHLYKMTAESRIPHYKPNGKVIYFKKQDLDDWIYRKRVKTVDEVRKEAENRR